MKKLIAITLISMTGIVYAGTAFFKYERQTGMTKQCVYDYLGSEYTITVKSYKICPLTINV